MAPPVPQRLRRAPSPVERHDACTVALAVALAVMAVGAPGFAPAGHAADAAGPVAAEQLPDLVPLEPFGVHVGAPDDGGNGRALRLATSTANRGAYALDLLAEPTDSRPGHPGRAAVPTLQTAVAAQCTAWTLAPPPLLRLPRGAGRVPGDLAGVARRLQLGPRGAAGRPRRLCAQLAEHPPRGTGVRASRRTGPAAGAGATRAERRLPAAPGPCRWWVAQRSVATEPGLAAR